MFFIYLIILIFLNLSDVQSAITNVQCKATFEPEVVIVKQFVNETHQKVRCLADLTNDNFTKPIFELSFGLSPNTGVFLLRGSDTECTSYGQRCWSDFKVFGFALRQLLLEAKEEETSGDEKVSMSHTHLEKASSWSSVRSSQIEFTCNVADTWRNKRISCSQSASIRFANTLTYGQKCSLSTETESECSSNMDCLGGRCVCQVGFLPYRLSRREILCLDKANLGEKCNFTQQCTAKEANTICENVSTLQERVCKCLSGYEEVKGENEQYHCVKIITNLLPIVSIKSDNNQQQSSIMNKNDTKKNDQFKINNNSSNILSQIELTKSKISSTTSTESSKELINDFEIFDSIDHSMDNHSNRDLRSMALAIAKSKHFIFIAIGLIVFLTIFLIALAIRSRNYGEMQVKKKKNSKISQHDNAEANSPFLGLVNKIGSVETDDETRNLNRNESPVRNDNDEYYEEVDEETLTHRKDSPFLSFESEDISNLHSKQSTV